jgi:signal-transduction protein with cAMP-binding, CBS, and nucleotidyltransferase domain
MTVSVEVAAIREFLAGCPPFDELPAEMLGRAACKVQIAYYRAGDPSAILDDPSQRL